MNTLSAEKTIKIKHMVYYIGDPSLPAGSPLGKEIVDEVWQLMVLDRSEGYDKVEWLCETKGDTKHKVVSLARKHGYTVTRDDLKNVEHTEDHGFPR